MHTSHTLTHTYGHRRTSTSTIIHASKHIYVNTHKQVSTPTHTPAHMHSRTHIRTHTRTHTYTYTHTCTHTCTHAQALTHVGASANTYTYFQNKNAFTDTTHIHTQIHSHAIKHAHEHASAHRIYKPTHKHTLVHSHLYVRALNHRQHALTCTLARSQADMHALGHSRSHIHTQECVRSVCVHVCACVSVGVCICVCVCVYGCVCGMCCICEKYERISVYYSVQVRVFKN